MSKYPETPDWDLTVPLAGTCGQCGADLSGETRVHATTEWVDRYYRDETFQRVINQSIARMAMARHARVCLGQRVAVRALPAWAVSA